MRKAGISKNLRSCESISTEKIGCVDLGEWAGFSTFPFQHYNLIQTYKKEIVESFGWFLNFYCFFLLPNYGFPFR